MKRQHDRLKIVIPFIFTFANVFFGFLSIIKTIEGDFIAAALCIIVAAVMDGLDGRIARYLGTSGDLGSELDSLCDAVSFCLAPAVLLYSWYLHDFGHVGLFAPALVLYLCAGLLRLARFNLLDNDQHIFFLGLPTTIAALFFAQLVLYQQFVGETLPTVLDKNVLVGLVASMAFLMLSSLKFPAFKKPNFSFRRLVTYFKIGFMVAIASWCYYYDYPFFLLLITAYILGSLLVNCFFKAKIIIKNRRS
jgi:CDP-diacylglycerol--serine O-phosphatidyltransferase